jgi:DNA-binding PadR family transcriptional regulator
MSGYDIKQLLGGLSWLVGSPSFGALYPGLHSLLEDGLVTVEVIPSEKRPPRKIYTITEAGTDAVRAWANQRVQPGGPLKEFVLRLVLADTLSQTNLTTYLEQRRDQLISTRPRISEALTATGADGDLTQRLALDYGLALADAELDWLDRTLSQLAEVSVGDSGASS